VSDDDNGGVGLWLCLARGSSQYSILLGRAVHILLADTVPFETKQCIRVYAQDSCVIDSLLRGDSAHWLTELLSSSLIEIKASFLLL
jgi:hypothetical protein